MENISNDELLLKSCDLLIPAALGNVINEKNYLDVKAKKILELANAPVAVHTYEHFKEKGVEIIPDILANAGGVIVSYFEWVQNLSNYYWSYEKVEQELKEKILASFREMEELKETNLNKIKKVCAHKLKHVKSTNVEIENENKKLTYREVAYILAISKILNSATIKLGL